MLVATDRGAYLQPNGLLTHIYPTAFFIFKSVFHLPSKWCRQRLTSTQLARSWGFTATVVQRFDSYNIDDLNFLISAPVNILFLWVLILGSGGDEQLRRDFYKQLDTFWKINDVSTVKRQV